MRNEGLTLDSDWIKFSAVSGLSIICVRGDFHTVELLFKNISKTRLPGTVLQLIGLFLLKSLALAQTQSASPKAKPWAKAFH